jgi:hypothetical protein
MARQRPDRPVHTLPLKEVRLPEEFPLAPAKDEGGPATATLVDAADPEVALEDAPAPAPRRTAATAGFSGFIKDLVSAPVGSKIVMPHGGVLTFASPSGARENAQDPAARFMPAGAFIRKLAEDTYLGFLPAGSLSRSPHAWQVEDESVQELAEAMRRALKGEA